MTLKKDFSAASRIASALVFGGAAEYHGSALRAVLFLFDHFSLPNRR